MCVIKEALISVLLEHFVWCFFRNVFPEPPTSVFSCLNYPPLNTDGAKAFGGFGAFLRCGYSTNMRETCRNVPGTPVCPLFLWEGGHHNWGGYGVHLMRPCHHLTETRCSQLNAISYLKDGIKGWGFNFVCKMFIEHTNKIEHIYKYIIKYIPIKHISYYHRIMTHRYNARIYFFLYKNRSICISTLMQPIYNI